MEELLPKIGIDEGGLGELYDGDSIEIGGGEERAILEPSQSLVVQL